MKYLEALNKRGLSVEQLPKALQKKIKDLDLQVSALKQIDENESQDLSESDLEDIEVIKNSVSELDNHIAHKVNIFDQTKYDAKLANVNKAKTARENLKKDREVGKQEVEVKEETPFVEQEVAEPVVAKVQQEPKQVEVQAPKQVQEPQVSDDTYEHEEEFERKGDGNPKKMTTGLILMGVGAFFLTWGAVNFFKSRR